MIERFEGRKRPGILVRFAGIGLVAASTSLGCFETKRAAPVSNPVPVATPTIDGGYYQIRQADPKSLEVMNLLHQESMVYLDAGVINSRLNQFPANQVALPVMFPDGYPVALWDRVDEQDKKYVGARVIPEGSMRAPLTGYMREVKLSSGEDGRLFELAPDNRLYVLSFLVGGKLDTIDLSFDGRRVQAGERVLVFTDPKEIKNSEDEVIIRTRAKLESPTYKPEISRSSFLKERDKFVTFLSPGTPR